MENGAQSSVPQMGMQVLEGGGLPGFPSPSAPFSACELLLGHGRSQISHHSTRTQAPLFAQWQRQP